MSIQLFKPYYRVDEVLSEIRDCLEKGWTGNGYKTLEFEAAWKTYTGLPYAHFLNSATAGLHLAVHQLKHYFNWRNGDEVITSPLTFVSTNHAILYEHLIPVFADVDEYLCLDPDSVKKKITPHTKAIIFTGIGGNAGQLDAIQQLCATYDLKLILDAAHMSGTYTHGAHVGTEADVSVFSFQSVKNLPTADSGMICWSHAEFDNWSRKLSWLGIDKSTYDRVTTAGYSWEYEVNEVGYKYHGNSVMAAMGLVGLKYLDRDNMRRNEIAAQYDQGFFDTPGIQPIEVAPDCVSSRHLYQLITYNREAIFSALRKANIGAGVHYITNQHYPMYRSGTYLPNAESASQHVLSLPMHVGLTSDDVDRIIEVVNDAAERSQPQFGRPHGVIYPTWVRKF